MIVIVIQTLPRYFEYTGCLQPGTKFRSDAPIATLEGSTGSTLLICETDAGARARLISGLLAEFNPTTCHCFLFHISITTRKTTTSKMQLGLDGKVILVTGNYNILSSLSKQPLNIELTWSRWHQGHRPGHRQGFSSRRRHRPLLLTNRVRSHQRPAILGHNPRRWKSPRQSCGHQRRGASHQMDQGFRCA